MVDRYKHRYEDGNTVCPYCLHSSDTIFINGHSQCVCCNTILESCCEGKGVYYEEKSKESREI